jgi:hypothetical protein
MVSRFVHNENIKRFEVMLRAEADAGRRAVLIKLLANERASDGAAFGVPDAKPAPKEND